MTRTDGPSWTRWLFFPCRSGSARAWSDGWPDRQRGGGSSGRGCRRRRNTRGVAHIAFAAPGAIAPPFDVVGHDPSRDGTMDGRTDRRPVRDIGYLHVAAEHIRHGLHEQQVLACQAAGEDDAVDRVQASVSNRTITRAETECFDQGSKDAGWRRGRVKPAIRPLRPESARGTRLPLHQSSATSPPLPGGALRCSTVGGEVLARVFGEREGAHEPGQHVAEGCLAGLVAPEAGRIAPLATPSIPGGSGCACRESRRAAEVPSAPTREPGSTPRWPGAPHANR